MSGHNAASLKLTLSPAVAHMIQADLEGTKHLQAHLGSSGSLPGVEAVGACYITSFQTVSPEDVPIKVG